MKHLLIFVWASFAGAVAVAGCGNGGGGNADGGRMASIPFDPFGTEPPGGGGLDPQPGRPAGSVEDLCAFDCTRIDAICPSGNSDAYCAANCTAAAGSFPGCETQFRDYLACVATAPITCTNGSASLTGCDTEITALDNCAGLASPPG